MEGINHFFGGDLDLSSAKLTIGIKEESGAFVGEFHAPASLFTGELLKGAGKLLPEVTPASLGWGRVFWSGGEAAKNAAKGIAKATGGLTLEQTRLGVVLDKLTNRYTMPVLKPGWNALSKRWAAGAVEAADVVLGSTVNEAGAWKAIEEPLLKSNGVSVAVHGVP